MTIKTKASVLAASLALLSAFGARSIVFADETLLAKAKITEDQAKQIALRRLGDGVVKSSELEEEHGHLVWSLDVQRPHRPGVTEIQIDARTGKIVLLHAESAAQEAKEAKAEAAPAK